MRAVLTGVTRVGQGVTLALMQRVDQRAGHHVVHTGDGRGVASTLCVGLL